MNKKLIMDLYEKYERKAQFETQNVQQIVDENLIKHIYEGSCPAIIHYYSPVSLSIDELIEREIAYFTAINQPFEWKVYGTDQPSDIGDRLLTKGFVKEETGSLLIRDIDDYQPNLAMPSEVECKRVTSKQMFRESYEVQNTEFPLAVDEQVDCYWPTYQDDENYTVYLVYESGKPVASARIDFTPNSPFAGMWAGTTLKEHRGKGYYKTLLEYRIHEAKQRGYRYVIIDALQISRPIVEKHGFKFITFTTPYVYTP